MIREGDIVKIKPEWQDPGDDKYTWLAVEDECDGRVLIMPLLGLPINPQQMVDVSMLVVEIE